MTFEEQLRQALAQCTERLRENIDRGLIAAADELVAWAQSERETTVTAALTEAREVVEREMRAAVAATREDRKAADLVASDRLAEAIRAMDRGRSLTEVLDTLVSCAGREASRVGVLLVRGEGLRGWRFVGFGPAFDPATQIEVSLTDAGLLAAAVRSGVPVSSDASGLLAPPPFAQLPGGRDAVAVPITLSGQVVTVLYADQGAADDGSAGSTKNWTNTLEGMSRHAARCLEVLTAFGAARALIEPRDASPKGVRDRLGAGETHPGKSVDEGTEETSEAARRYARLLISEIKLYHEAAVVAGRRERDLAVRLGAEIARARVLYQQRVGPQPRPGTDYFYAELVRTLANGDASLLGQLEGKS